MTEIVYVPDSVVSRFVLKNLLNCELLIGAFGVSSKKVKFDTSLVDIHITSSAEPLSDFFFRCRSCTSCVMFLRAFEAGIFALETPGGKPGGAFPVRLPRENIPPSVALGISHFVLPPPPLRDFTCCFIIFC